MASEDCRVKVRTAGVRHKPQAIGMTAGHVSKNNEGDGRGRQGMGNNGRGWLMTAGG